MKKIVFLLLISVYAFCIPAFAATYVVYRLSSGEVVTIANDLGLGGYPTGMFEVLTDPTLIDGSDLTPPKIYAGGVVRNATQQEIDGFAAFKTDDYNQAEADKAAAYFQDDPRLRRILKAFADVVRTRTNAIAAWNMELKAAVAASNSLEDYQSRVAALGDLPAYDFNEMVTAIINRIDKDD